MNPADCLRFFAEQAEVVSPGRFRVAGEWFDMPASPSSEAMMEGVVAHLEDILYRNLYTCPTPGGPPVSPTLQREFLARLSAANTGSGTFDSGWVVRQVEPDGSLAAEKDGLTVWALPHEFLSPHGAVAAGARVVVRIGKEQRGLLPGFYLAFSNALFQETQNTPAIIRVYWHITAAGAPPLVRALTLELNSLKLPFRFKTLSDPQFYARADAAVLYIGKRHYVEARPALVKVYRHVKPWLAAGVPLMTKQVANGVGLAEDPEGTLASFGQHRCRMVAESLWHSFEAGHLTTAERLDDLTLLFGKQGFDVDRLYLQPGSCDDYLSLERHAARSGRKAR